MASFSVNNFKVILLAIFFSTLIGIIKFETATAAVGLSRTFPDPNYTTTSGTTPSPLYLTVGSGDFDVATAGATIMSDTTGTFTLTISHAEWCNNDLDLPTQFGLPYKKTLFRVNAVTGDSAATYGYGADKASYTTTFEEDCTPDKTITFTLTASDKKTALNKYVAVVIGSQLFQPANPAYDTTVPTAQENSFRFTIDGPAGSNVGMTLLPPKLGSTYYNFSNRNRTSTTQLSSSIFVSTPCSITNQKVEVQFYDTDDYTDYRSSRGTLQSGGSYSFPLNFNVRRSPKGSSTFTNVAFSYNDSNALTPIALWNSPSSTGAKKIFGGQREKSQTFEINMDRDYVYQFSISGLSQANAISFDFLTEIDPLFSTIECDQAPIGFFDSASCTELRGWARDLDLPNRSINVHVYEGGPAGTGTFVGGYLANGVRTDVSTTGNHGFVINVPAQYRDGRAHTFYIYALGIDSAGVQNGNNPQLSNSPRTTPVCSNATASCEIRSPATGSSYEPGQTFTISMRITRTGGLGSIVVTPSARIGTTTLTPTPATVTLTETSTFEDVNFGSRTTSSADLNTGSFTISGAITWPGNSDTCGTAGTVYSVVRKPFFNITNGDLLVGGEYPSGTPATCPGTLAASSANAYSWALSPIATAADRKGANTEHVAKILGTALGVYSASAISTTNLKLLTIANNESTKLWGGGSGGITCMSDFYTDTIKADASTITSPYSLSTAAIPTSQQVKITGNLNLNGATSFSNKLALYVTGDVYITSNITMNTIYTSNNLVTGTSDINKTPFFALIVKGDIYVAPGVTQLDGMYVAQPNGANGGTIFTCAKGAFTSYSTTDLTASPSTYFTNCGNSLTFNGIVQSKKMRLHRNGGTLISGVAAERFNSLPELYLTNTPFKASTSEGAQYDSAATLPPLL